MSNLNESNKLSAEDLKSQLFQSMQSTGVLKQLKGQLRQSMINELRGKNKKKKGHSQTSDLLAATIKQRNTYTWIQQAIDNLVYLHLKQNRYQYSLSLFQQESSIDSYCPSLADDLLKRLGLQMSDIDMSMETPGSSLSEDVPQHSSTPARRNSQPSILWRILEKLSEGLTSRPTEEKENTNFGSKKEEKPLTLGEKLKAIDDEMSLKPKPRIQDPTIAVSSYATAVRRAEEDADRRSRAALEQWKALELTRTKMEEAKKAKETIDSRTKELERDYQMKRDALQARERAAISRMNNQREMLEKEMHDQRQTLLRELDQMRMREDTLQKQEQLMLELEKTKHKELSILKDQLGSSHGSRKDFSSTATIPRSMGNIEGSSEMQSVLRQLEDKSKDIHSLKKEIELLKVELSNSHLQRHSQTERENLILKSHLDQLTREVSGNKTGVGSERCCKSDVEEKLRQQLEVLKQDKAEEETQRRQLAETLKVMQVALEDSNKALANLNSQQKRVTFTTDGDVESTNLEKLISSYSPPQKEDSLRNYEPVDSRIQLHPDIISSDDFDDASMNEQVASSGIRLDIRCRLKDLETETDKASERYQRYLNTYYRDAMEARSRSRTRNSHNLDQADRPVHTSIRTATDPFAAKPTPLSSWSAGLQRPDDPPSQIVVAEEVPVPTREIPPVFPSGQSIPSNHSSVSSLSSDKRSEQFPWKDSSVFAPEQSNAGSTNHRVLQRPDDPPSQIVVAEEVPVPTREIPPVFPSRQSIPSNHSSFSSLSSSDKRNELFPWKDSSVFAPEQSNAGSTNHRGLQRPDDTPSQIVVAEEVPTREIPPVFPSHQGIPSNHSSFSSLSSSEKRNERFHTKDSSVIVPGQSDTGSTNHRETANFELRISVDSLEQNPESEPSSSSKSSGESRSPQIDTVRRVDYGKQPPQDLNKSENVAAAVERSLPPLAAPRRLPNLPSIQRTSQSPPLSPTVFNTASTSLSPARHPEKNASGDEDEKSRSDSSLSNDAFGTPVQSKRKVVVDITLSDVTDSSTTSVEEDKENVKPTYKSAIDFQEELREFENRESYTYIPSQPNNDSPSKLLAIDPPLNPNPQAPLDDGIGRRVADDQDIVSSISSVSEEILSAFSSSMDSKSHLPPPVWTMQKEANEDVAEPIAPKSSASLSDHKKVEKADSYSSGFTTEDESATQKSLEEPEPQSKKTLADFNLSDDNDISAALRWEDENRPSLDFDEENVVMQIQESAHKDGESPEEEADVFETSEPLLSLDSTPGGHADPHGKISDDSW